MINKVMSAADQLFGVVELGQVWSTLLTIGCSLRHEDLKNFVDIVLFSAMKLRICEDEAAHTLLPIFICKIVETRRVNLF